MDCNKVGSLIFKLRKENLTQKQLADIMNISDKTISKWERGLDVQMYPFLVSCHKYSTYTLKKYYRGIWNPTIQTEEI